MEMSVFLENLRRTFPQKCFKSPEILVEVLLTHTALGGMEENARLAFAAEFMLHCRAYSETASDAWRN